VRPDHLITVGELEEGKGKSVEGGEKQEEWQLCSH
jgi:hypothetical protein